MPQDLDIQLRYVGARFEGAKLPLDVLADLPAFRDLVVAYAKQRWRDLNADRQRVPKGFEQSLIFDLVAIKDGSAIPALSWDRNAAQERLPGFADELQLIVHEAIGQVVSLVTDAANGIYPKALSAEHVRALNRFGSSLRDDERIEFLGSSDKNGNVVYLDSARRKNLITKVRETYVSRYEGTGIVVGVYAAPDEPRGQVTVRTQTYGEVTFNVDHELAKAEFATNIGAQVQFEIEVELDNADNFCSVVELYGLTVIDDRLAVDVERCRSRLQALAELRDGWDGEDSKAVSLEARQAAEALLAKRPLLSSQYKIFPTRAGGLLFEFIENGWDLSVEFALDGAIEFFGFQEDGDTELLPLCFSEVNAEFIELFDKQVGRNGK
ncbi:hypothetical protein G7939_02310 [Ralstonia solanacearum]|uniref:hypothetical protein n=1 Tax=Ralstonia pseudosolanacearum TaxID=1310165 RepID=UPI000B60F49D|nr:hypothetical protein [Ralstonia pseudosolanacearum]QIK22361.1 hypothetical protein G7939_02310 [Ralstonia solanacearum]ASL73023.1 hypothetical protein BC350_04775 [Ralstonia pseudosolanacearum]MCK4120273.1 hypothetical protein [Ralstonia pseudosolanacearum]QIK29603.1 hypothetical protein G7947_15515 [Ralstonia solanacearum]QIK34508.1 hypothetical protein G7969_15515 [Ralstonia solanacearum]